MYNPNFDEQFHYRRIVKIWKIKRSQQLLHVRTQQKQWYWNKGHNLRRNMFKSLNL